MAATSIQVFLDESADEKKEIAYVVAGFIGADVNWATFAEDWRAVMATHGFDDVTFHMVDFNACTKEPWIALKNDKARKESLLNGLLDVIKRHDLFAAGGVALVSEFKAFSGSPWDDPYKLCLEVVIFGAIEVCDVAPNGKIQFVCDENDEMSKYVLPAFERVKQNNPQHAGILGELKFATDDEKPELCAADLFASELRRNVQNHMVFPEVPMRYPMKRIAEGLYRIWKVDFSQVIPPGAVIKNFPQP